MLIIDPMSVVIAVVLCLLGVGGGYLARKNVAEGKIGSAEETAKQILEEAKKAAMPKRRKRCWKPRKKSNRLRSEMERENKERRSRAQQK